jgi:hypothetical protein
MKRLLLILALALIPAALVAQTVDRDVLLASDGTLYTIESKADAESNTTSLQLTVSRGARTTVTSIPETLTGANWAKNPALAYDSESKTLFAFWLGVPSGMSSTLYVAAYHDGKWMPAVSIDEQAFHFRNNLRIAITRHVSTLQPDGTYADAPGLLVHAVWWESVGNTEQARYALFTIDNWRVKDYELHDLSEFTAASEPGFMVDQNFNPEILRHPAIIEGMNSVDVLFGDAGNMSMNRVTLKPIADGRVHIPVGTRGGHPFPPPQTFSANWTGRISTIASGKNLVLYNTTRDATNYVMFANGVWSEVRTLPLSPTFSADAATVVLNRMLAAQQ